MRWYERIRDLLRPLDAREEGLAAGTGVLTGKVAERAVTDVQECPMCRRDAAVVDALDLVEKVAHHVCTACNYRWSDRRVTVHAPH